MTALRKSIEKAILDHCAGGDLATVIASTIFWPAAAFLINLIDRRPIDFDPYVPPHGFLWQKIKLGKG